eukprot:jgi/Chrzof1/744/Cz01g27030.t1
MADASSIMQPEEPVSTSSLSTADSAAVNSSRVAAVTVSRAAAYSLKQIRDWQWLRSRLQCDASLVDAAYIATLLKRLAAIKPHSVKGSQEHQREFSSFLQHVLQLAQQHVHDATPSELTDMLWAVAKLGVKVTATSSSRRGTDSSNHSSSTGGGGGTGHRDQCSIHSQQLLQAACLCMHSNMNCYQPRQLALCTWSLGKLGWLPGQQFWDSYMSCTKPQLAAFNSQDLSNILWALAKLQQQPPAAWMSEVLWHAQQLLPQCSPQATANILLSLPSLGCAPGPAWLQQTEKLLQPKLQQLGPYALASLLGAVLKLSHVPSPDWMQDFEAAALATMYSMNGQDTVNLLHALAVLGELGMPPPQQLQQALLQRLMEVLPSCRISHVTLGMWSVVKQQQQLACKNPCLVQQLLVKCMAAIQPDIHLLNCHDLAHLMWVLANSGSRLVHPDVSISSSSGTSSSSSSSVLKSLLSAIRAQLPRMDPHALSVVMLSVVHLNLQPGWQWMLDFYEKTLPVLPRCKPQDLTDIGWALAQMGQRPMHRWMLAYLQAVQQLLPSFPAPLLAKLAGSLSHRSWQACGQLLSSMAPSWQQGFWAAATCGMGELSLYQLSSLLNVAHVIGFTTCGSSILGLFAATTRHLPHAGMQELLHLLLPVAKLSGDLCLPEQWLHTLLQQLMRCCHMATPQQIRKTIVALAAISQQIQQQQQQQEPQQSAAAMNNALMECSSTLVAAVECKVSSIPLPELTRILSASSAVSGVVPDDTLAAFQHHILSTAQPLLPYASLYELACLLRTASKTGVTLNAAFMSEAVQRLGQLCQQLLMVQQQQQQQSHSASRMQSVFQGFVHDREVISDDSQDGMYSSGSMMDTEVHQQQQQWQCSMAHPEEQQHNLQLHALHWQQQLVQDDITTRPGSVEVRCYGALGSDEMYSNACTARRGSSAARAAALHTAVAPEPFTGGGVATLCCAPPPGEPLWVDRGDRYSSVASAAAMLAVADRSLTVAHQLQSRCTTGVYTADHAFNHQATQTGAGDGHSCSSNLQPLQPMPAQPGSSSPHHSKLLNRLMTGDGTPKQLTHAVPSGSIPDKVIDAVTHGSQEQSSRDRHHRSVQRAASTSHPALSLPCDGLTSFSLLVSILASLARMHYRPPQAIAQLVLHLLQPTISQLPPAQVASLCSSAALLSLHRDFPRLMRNQLWVRCYNLITRGCSSRELVGLGKALCHVAAGQLGQRPPRKLVVALCAAVRLRWQHLNSQERSLMLHIAAVLAPACPRRAIYLLLRTVGPQLKELPKPERAMAWHAAKQLQHQLRTQPSVVPQ